MRGQEKRAARAAQGNWCKTAISTEAPPKDTKLRQRGKQESCGHQQEGLSPATAKRPNRRRREVATKNAKNTEMELANPPKSLFVSLRSLRLIRFNGYFIRIIFRMTLPPSDSSLA
jgi:hypothetical protein